jgi:asparagine synthase (glutamine-hydrolysing)
MCGIAGYVLRNGPANLATVRAMCDQIKHRGPDDEGYHVQDGCAIGMRRLSIIDLNTGHQPIANEDQSIWVVFNGEIYNYQELRRNLIAQGHRFRTESDTEVLLHLYEQEGEQGIAKLRGMFAYAIWDATRRELLIVRDRFGKKPLYYAVRPEGLYFGSELKCLRVAGVPFDSIDREALQLYLRLTYIPDPWTAYQGIGKLEPASWLRYRADGTVRQGRYWTLPTPAEVEPEGLTQEEARARLRDSFDESVRMRMIADVPLGAFLSGGIDSASIVASMAGQSSQPVKTFSIGFEEPGFNELPLARLIAAKYQTDHHELIVRPSAVELVEKLVSHFDEPFGDSSAIPTYLVSEFAAQHVKVVLTGDGGDELFAGYPNILKVHRLRRVDALPLTARRAISWIASKLPYSAYGKNFLHMISRPSALDRYFELIFMPYFMRRRLLRPAWRSADDSNRMFERFLPDEPADIVNQALYFEMAANLSGDMLVKVDRMSMANSLEARCPFLDHELAEMAARMPYKWKVDGTVRPGKRIFVEAIADRLPPELLTAPKAGFGVPLASWFRSSLRSFLWDHLTGARFRDRGVCQPDFLNQLLVEHDSGRRDNYHVLWRLLMLEIWFEQQEGDPGVGVATPVPGNETADSPVK